MFTYAPINLFTQGDFFMLHLTSKLDELGERGFFPSVFAEKFIFVMSSSLRLFYFITCVEIGSESLIRLDYFF